MTTATMYITERERSGSGFSNAVTRWGFNIQLGTRSPTILSSWRSYGSKGAATTAGNRALKRILDAQ